MFAETEALGLFPTYIWMHQLEPSERDRINNPIRSKLESIRGDTSDGVPPQGWQTDQVLHRQPEFQALNEIILAAADGVINFLHVTEETLEITSCWANINPKGATQPWHTHPNNYLGGVYYVDMPDGAATINFQDPRAQASVVSPRVRQSTPENSGRAVVPVKEGMLLLFPAWLAHSVSANPSAQERVSISFNLMFSSFTETVSPTKWQGNLPVT